MILLIWLRNKTELNIKKAPNTILAIENSFFSHILANFYTLIETIVANNIAD